MDQAPFTAVTDRNRCFFGILLYFDSECIESSDYNFEHRLINVQSINHTVSHRLIDLEVMVPE